MMIELHSYIGAFRPTDKVRPGFRDRYGTLYVLTHSKPYNKKFVIIQTKNIISEHFKCRQDYVYLCEAPNQAAHRYNNVPGGKISFSSHLNSLNMNCKFVTDLIPNIDEKALGLSPEATVKPDDVVLALVPIKEYEDSYNSPTSVIIRESVKALQFAKAIQKAQIADFLQNQLKMDEVEIPEGKYDAVIDAINYFLECEEADKSTAEALIIEQIAASDVNEPVSLEEVVAVFEEKIENGTLNVATGLPREEEIAKGDSTEQLPADALQITPVAAQPTVISRTPGTVELPAQKVSDLFVAGRNLAEAATKFNDQLTGMIVQALENVAAESQNSVETEDAQINL